MSKKAQAEINSVSDKSPIPRMRTAPGIIAEIKALDPATEVTEYWVRQLIQRKAVPVVWAGKKALVNLDDVLDLLRSGTEPMEPKPDTVGGIRRIKEGRI